MNKISVVTICYNAEKCIEETIKSVLSQSYNNYEYIFIDGASKDKTLDIINAYRRKFEDRGIAVKISSEKDKGIFDAMNKSKNFADSDYIIFMNAGDKFFDDKVLEDVFCNNLDADVIYGDYVCFRKGYYKLRKALSLSEMENQMPFCHQSTFVKTSLFKKENFSLDYKIAGDYEYMVRLYKLGKKFQHVDRVISIYDFTGVSSTNQRQARIEDHKLREVNGLKSRYSLKHDIFLSVYVEGAKNIVRKFIPKIYFNRKHGWYKDIKDIK